MRKLLNESSEHPVGKGKNPSHGKNLRSPGLSQSGFVYLDCGARIACTASVEEDDKTFEKWETRMTRVAGIQRQGHTEMKCMHLWVMEIACDLPNVSLMPYLGKSHVTWYR